MSFFDYKVVPAPRRAKRTPGVHGPELFALTLTEAINEQARHGWEYVRAERLTAEPPGGWFRRPVAEEQCLLVFRRERESLDPKLAAAPDPAPVAERPAERVAERAQPRATDRSVPERGKAAPVRREPVLAEIDPVTSAPPVPLRPPRQLGPAERT